MVNTVIEMSDEVILKIIVYLLANI